MNNLKIIHTLIVDDEPNNVEFLQALLKENCPSIKVIATTNSPTEAILLIQQMQPQLVFMDVDMPEMTGFELLKMLEPLAFETIFVTAFNQYAMEAFECNAIGYVTKPIVIEKLTAAVEKAITKIDEKKYTQHIFSLMENMHQSNNMDKIALPTMQGFQFIKINQVSYAESCGNYTNFFLEDNTKIIVSRQLGEYEKLLPADNFVRIHDKHIINLNFIKEYIKGNGGEVILETGARLAVASRRKDELLNRFEKWLKKK